jgi:plasmid stabilization system protein ParE
MRIRWRPEVVEEVAEAIEHLEGERPGSGHRFRDELEAALSRLRAFPELGSLRYRDVRVAVLRRFNYVIAYRIRGDEIRVLAILHGSRHPSRWRRRAEES